MREYRMLARQDAHQCGRTLPGHRFECPVAQGLRLAVKKVRGLCRGESRPLDCVQGLEGMHLLLPMVPDHPGFGFNIIHMVVMKSWTVTSGGRCPQAA